MAAGGRLYLPSATFEELCDLPGLGPALARRIIEYRSRELIDDIDSLMAVPGMTTALLNRLRPRLSVDDPCAPPSRDVLPYKPRKPGVPRPVPKINRDRLPRPPQQTTGDSLSERLRLVTRNDTPDTPQRYTRDSPAAAPRQDPRDRTSERPQQVSKNYVPETRRRAAGDNLAEALQQTPKDCTPEPPRDVTKEYEPETPRETHRDRLAEALRRPLGENEPEPPREIAGDHEPEILRQATETDTAQALPASAEDGRLETVAELEEAPPPVTSAATATRPSVGGMPRAGSRRSFNTDTDWPRSYNGVNPAVLFGEADNALAGDHPEPVRKGNAIGLVRATFLVLSGALLGAALALAALYAFNESLYYIPRQQGDPAVVQRLSTIEAAQSGLSERLSSLEDTVATLDARLGDNADTLTALGADVAETADQLEELESEVSSVQRRIVQFGSFFENLKSALDRLVP